MRVRDVCPHYPSGVPDDHRCNAAVVLVGEAPGEQEDDTGLPFVGPSGWTMDKVWQTVGMRRSDVYITNVLDYRPGNFSNDIHLVGARELAQGRASLLERLRARFTTDRPCVVVPTGNTALYALTGKTSITKWRGSIIEADCLWPGQKCIGTLHPAGLLRQPNLAKTLLADWKRIASDRKFLDFRIPSCEWMIHPTKGDANDFLALVLGNPAQPLAIDIETSRDGRIICVGFAISNEWSITFDWTTFHAIIRKLCESPNPKIGQNLMFDIWHLYHHGVKVQNYRWDCSCLFHCLDPNPGPIAAKKPGSDEGGASKLKCFSLGYMASLFTRWPYWKDDPKDEGEGSQVRDSETWWHDFLTYNGKDNTGAYGIYEQLVSKLSPVGVARYHRLYSSLFGPLVRLMLTGVRLDVPAAEAAHERFATAARTARDAAERLAGQPLHSITRGASWYVCDKCKGKAGTPTRHKTPTPSCGGAVQALPVKVVEGESISNDKLKKYLYSAKRDGGLGLPARKKKGRITADEAALRSLRLAYPDRCGAVVGEILQVRRNEKLASFVSGGVVSSDGRIHSQYKQLVQTGRLSSAGNPGGTGANLQNTDASLMHLLKPDKGKIFLRGDLSQAESRVVDALTGVPALVEKARSDPRKFDSHTVNAAEIFSRVYGRVIRPVKGKADDEVSGEMRQLGKRGKHAYNYGMTYMKLAEVLAKDGPKMGINRIVTEAECQAILEAVADTCPEIATHYQRPVRDIIRTSGKLTNSWGAEIDFGVEYRYAVRDNQRQDIFRKGYAWTPQGEVGRLMNVWGLVPLQEWIDANSIDCAINLQRHDELVVSVHLADAYTVASFLVSSLERERVYTLGDDYPRTALVIPVELAFGLDCSHDNQLEFKRLPSREEFEEELNKWYTDLTSR